MGNGAGVRFGQHISLNVQTRFGSASLVFVRPSLVRQRSPRSIDFVIKRGADVVYRKCLAHLPLPMIWLTILRYECQAAC